MTELTSGIEQYTVDEKLARDKFIVDEDPHIVLKSADEIDINEYRKLVLACPAGLYKISEDDSLSFDHAGCLECGTCRVLCGETVLAKWEFPQGSFGIEYRYG